MNLEIFKPGKVTFVLDGGAGSSAKGLRGAYIWKYYKEKHTTVAFNTFLENAAHTITHKNGEEYIHQCLCSITTLRDYEKQFLSPGCAFSKETFLKEMEVTQAKSVGIHPNAVIVTQKDVDYEKGICDFEGNMKAEQESANLRIGSTLHGVGAARARRILRRSDVVLAKDVPELKPYICQTHEEIMERLDKGQSILGEIAQGYQLSLMSKYYPKTTSRNCSVSACLDDSLLPPSVVGPVVVNFRTFPIRVNSNKYIRKSDKKILTWAEWNETPENDKVLIKGDSGGCYDDQTELTWDEVSRNAGATIFEQTSLTKLPRRVYSFSNQNMIEALTYNNTGDDLYISINFLNYVDASVQGKTRVDEVLTPKIKDWLCKNVFKSGFPKKLKINGIFLGTWKTIDDSSFLTIDEIQTIL